jgi:sulfur transfer protein SufE
MKIKDTRRNSRQFSMFDDWMELAEYIIELGKKLPLIKRIQKK